MLEFHQYQWFDQKAFRKDQCIPFFDYKERNASEVDSQGEGQVEFKWFHQG